MLVDYLTNTVTGPSSALIFWFGSNGRIWICQIITVVQLACPSVLAYWLSKRPDFGYIWIPCDIFCSAAWIRHCGIRQIFWCTMCIWRYDHMISIWRLVRFFFITRSTHRRARKLIRNLLVAVGFGGPEQQISLPKFIFSLHWRLMSVWNQIKKEMQGYES